MSKDLSRRTSSRKWNIEFSWRFATEHQRRVIADLGILAQKVLVLFLTILIPDAIARESGGILTSIGFRTRADARRFSKQFGGTLSTQKMNEPRDHQ
jgi:hypothetical protein